MKLLKNYSKKYWIFIACMIAVWLFFHYTNNDVQIKRQLENNDYEVLDAFCTQSSAIIDMMSLGNREDQVHSALYWSTYYCSPPQTYYITILDPTRECIYGFNGDLVRLNYKDLDTSTIHIGLGDWQLTESAKRNIEDDITFLFWKLTAKKSYEDYLKSPSEFSELSYAYEEYLKNGLNSQVARFVVKYEIEHGCD